MKRWHLCLSCHLIIIISLIARHTFRIISAFVSRIIMYHLIADERTVTVFYDCIPHFNQANQAYHPFGFAKLVTALLTVW